MRSLFLLALLGADLLGPAVRQDGYTFRPPKGFRMARMDIFHGTRAGAVAPNPATPGFLSAALVDSEGEDGASLLISVVESHQDMGPGARDALAGDVVRHFNTELGQKFAIERTDQLDGVGQRLEVLGSVRQGSQLRKLVVASFPAETRHVVIIVSVPSGRWDLLLPSVRESFDSFRPESSQRSSAPRTAAWAALALVASLLLASVGLWRRRRAAQLTPP